MPVLSAGKTSSKFGRKTLGKITPWEEASIGSSGSLGHRLSQALNVFRKPLNSTELNERFRVFRRDFKSTSFFTRNFMILDLLRQLTIVNSIIFLPDWPLTSLSIITSVNFLLMLAITVLRPYNTKRMIFQNLFNEICLLSACCAAFYLAVCDKIGNFDVSSRLVAGWVIVYSNLTIIYFFMGMVICDFILAAYRAADTAKKIYLEKFKDGISRSEKSRRRREIIKDLMGMNRFI